MGSNWLLRSALAFSATLVAQGRGWAAPETQAIQIEHTLQIPEAVLEPGQYTFSVEDRLRDRAIIRIQAVETGRRYFLLTTPSDRLGEPAAHGLLFFRSDGGDRPVLKGWACPGCSMPLEVAYPKTQALKITHESGEPVLAVDPEYDKLPANLSADDKKVVTLWLLSPKRITAAHHGQGVDAKKYVAVESGTVETAHAPALSGTARMPKTASHTNELGLSGLLLTVLALGLLMARRGITK